MDWYRKEIDVVLADFSTGSKGISQEEAKRRLKEYGPNVFAREERFRLLKLFFGQFKNLLIIILLLAGVISYVVGATSDALVIFVIVLLNVLIGFFQEFKTEKSLQALRKLVSSEAVVIRDGAQRQIPAEQIVPGDILVLNEGMKIPADARVISSVHLAVD
ncbi:MAG: cation-transporting P-type ATPase, partial [Nanoarchaeota archaeon]